MIKAQDCKTIDEVRGCIDSLDNEIIEAIATRFEYAKEIVRFKSDEESIIARPRYEAVIENRRAIAVKNGLDPDVIEKMYRLMMNYFIEEELKILKQKK